MASVRRFSRHVFYYTLINGSMCSLGISTSYVAHQIAEYLPFPAFSYQYLFYALRIVILLAWFMHLGKHKGHYLRPVKPRPPTIPCARDIINAVFILLPAEAYSHVIANANFVTSNTTDAIVYQYGCFILQSFLYELVLDFFHYGVHRLAHSSPFLYQQLHKHHHAELYPTPHTTYNQNVVDLLFSNLIPSIVAFSCVARVLPLTQLQFIWILTYKTQIEIGGHANIKVKGGSFPQFPYLQYLGHLNLEIEDHTWHHLQPKTNFSKRFRIWDYVFRTYQPPKVKSRTLI